MNKKLAFDNRLCYERTVARQHAIHQQKLQTMLPTPLSPSKVYLDSNAPSRHPHLSKNAKRKQMTKEQQLAIASQNQRLASKMEQIRHRQENVVLAAASTYGTNPRSPRACGGDTAPRTPLQDPSSPPPPTAFSTQGTQRVTPAAPKTQTLLLPPKKSLPHSPARVYMPGIRLNATQTPVVDCYLSPEVSIDRGAACTKRSLINKGVQKRQQERIAEENRRMKERVQGQKTSYNTKQWDAEWQKAGHKFGHLRQNGTVGYLLPPPRTANGVPHAGFSLRTPPTQRKLKTSHGLPLIDHAGEADTPSRTTRMQQKSSEHASKTSNKSKQEHPRTNAKARHAGGRRQVEKEEDGDDDRFPVVELPPCVLLEATTRKGVHLQVQELQIEMARDRTASGMAVGDRCVSCNLDDDRGLVIRGTWMGGVEGTHRVSAETLERIAQEIDDIEIMIKLETITRMPHVGNFPRLSVLLTEEELEKVLMRLVERMNIELLEDRNELRISTRPPRTLPSRDENGARDGGDVERGQRRSRPRTCPSTMPSAKAHSQEWMWPSIGDDNSPDHEESVRIEMQQQLGSLFTIRKRRYGLQHKGGFYLVKISLPPASSTLAIHAVGAGDSAHVCVQEVTYSPGDIEALLHQLEDQELTQEELVEHEIRRVLQRLVN